MTAHYSLITLINLGIVPDLAMPHGMMWVCGIALPATLSRVDVHGCHHFRGPGALGVRL